jgi:hypothetical protein
MRRVTVASRAPSVTTTHGMSGERERMRATTSAASRAPCRMTRSGISSSMKASSPVTFLGGADVARGDRQERREAGAGARVGAGDEHLEPVAEAAGGGRGLCRGRLLPLHVELDGRGRRRDGRAGEHALDRLAHVGAAEGLEQVGVDAQVEGVDGALGGAVAGEHDDADAVALWLR